MSVTFPSLLQFARKLLTHPLFHIIIWNSHVVFIFTHPFHNVCGTSIFEVKFAQEVIQICPEPISTSSFGKMIEQVRP